MNNLLSKEHYCYKVHTLLMKSIAYPLPPFYRQPPYMDSPPPFLQENFHTMLCLGEIRPFI